MSWTFTKRTYTERVSRRGWRVVKNERISNLANAIVCAVWLAVKMYTPRYLYQLCGCPVFWLVVDRGVPEGEVKVLGGAVPMAWVLVLLRLRSRPHSLATVSKKFKICCMRSPSSDRYGRSSTKAWPDSCGEGDAVT